MWLGFSVLWPQRWLTVAAYRQAHLGVARDLDRWKQANRNVHASTVAKMVLSNDARARIDVDAAVLLRKAPDWQYEKEWRLLGSRGPSDSALEMTEITFGMRCDGAIMHTVASALKDRDKEVKLYEMHEVRGTFELRRSVLEVAELAAYSPRRAQSVLEDFAPQVPKV